MYSNLFLLVTQSEIVGDKGSCQVLTGFLSTLTSEVLHCLHVLRPCSAATPKKLRFCKIFARTCAPDPWHVLADWVHRRGLCHLTDYVGLAMRYHQWNAVFTLYMRDKHVEGAANKHAELKVSARPPQAHPRNPSQRCYCGNRSSFGGAEPR